MRILVIEDDHPVAQSIREELTAEGYEVLIARTGEGGLRLLEGQTFDLIVLDIMLPDRDGLEVLGAIRKHGLQTPVLLLTARGDVSDRVAGLDKGADDYVVKPFSLVELAARVRAILRRGRVEDMPRLAVGDLVMDFASLRVWRGGEDVRLTVREYELLAYLMRHHGQVVSRGMLARDVWKETERATPLDNVMDVHISRLRRKIDGSRKDKLIHTVRGVGFRLGEPSA